jgi:hypothetical protein
LMKYLFLPFFDVDELGDVNHACLRGQMFIESKSYKQTTPKESNNET